jgi:hypothetical protein
LALSSRRRPTKPCDHEAAAVVDAEHEFRVACAALDEAEKQRDAPPLPIESGGPVMPADLEFLNNLLYRAVVDAATRQGAARLNLEVAQKRLADCLAAAAADAPLPTYEGEPSAASPTEGERFLNPHEASEENRRERNILSPTREGFDLSPTREGFDPVPPDASNPPPNDDDPPRTEIG